MAKSEEIRMKEEFLEQYRKSVEEEQYLLVEIKELRAICCKVGLLMGCHEEEVDRAIWQIGL